jgi:hypothetical protein
VRPDGGTRRATRPGPRVAGARPAASTSPRPADWSTIRAPSTCARPTCYPTWTAGSPACSTRQPRCPLDALIAASQDASGTAEALRKVERTLADCRRKLARYRAGLDAGADLATVTEWINHATAERAGAEAKRAQLRAATPVAVTKDQLRAVVRQAGGLVRILDSADPGQRAQRSEKLGIVGSTSQRSDSLS